MVGPQRTSNFGGESSAQAALFYAYQSFYYLSSTGQPSNGFDYPLEIWPRLFCTAIRSRRAARASTTIGGRNLLTRTRRPFR